MLVMWLNELIHNTERGILSSAVVCKNITDVTDTRAACGQMQCGARISWQIWVCTRWSFESMIAQDLSVDTRIICKAISSSNYFSSDKASSREAKCFFWKWPSFAEHGRLCLTSLALLGGLLYLYFLTLKWGMANFGSKKLALPYTVVVPFKYCRLLNAS